MLGKKMTEETKKRLKEINLGRKHSEESKKKMSDAHKGRIYKPLTEEHKNKLSESNKGKHIITDEIKNKISNPQNLQDFCEENYQFDSSLSNSKKWFFTR